MAALNNWQGYLAANKDLGAAGITDQAGAQAHWDQFGSKENRSQGGILSSAAPATTASTANGGSITSAQGTTYSPDQIKQFFASNPDPTAIARQASAMGLNKDQILSAMNTAGYGGADSASRSAAIDNFVGGSNDGFTFGPHGELQTGDLSGKVWQGTQQVDYGGDRKAFSGGLTGQNGQYYSDQQIKDFYKANPNMNPAEEISALEKFGLHGMDLYKARSIANGTPYGGGIYRDTNTDKQYENYVIASRAAGHAPELGYDEWISAGHAQGIARTPGSGWLTDFDQNAWSNRFTGKGQEAVGNGGGVRAADPWMNQGGSVGSPSVGGGVPAGAGSTTSGSVSSGSTGGASSSSGGSNAPGNWQVTPEQTVESRIAGILSSGSPLLEKARAGAQQGMIARGLQNSSMAQTAGDSAVYDAALQIAKPDAATYADAAKTNSLADTQWGISQMNNQTSRDNTSANIVAQRELQQATQLYNNLATQTSTASSIQQWGLNTITAIQASDLSADAKNAAIANIQQYLADSYTIQGDWHTSAARAIDAIFD